MSKNIIERIEKKINEEIDENSIDDMVDLINTWMARFEIAKDNSGSIPLTRVTIALATIFSFVMNG